MSARRWISQSPSSSLCGQIAVAVIANVPLAEVVAVIGHIETTWPRDLARALRHFGYECPDRCRAMRNWPGLGIGKLRYPGQRIGHYIAFADGRIYDGIHGTADGKLTVWPKGSRIVSWLPVTKR